MIDARLSPTERDRRWVQAMHHAVYLHNRLPAAGQLKTPQEQLLGIKPSVKLLGVWGSPAYICDKDPTRKLQLTSKNSVFVGYDSSSKAACVYGETADQLCPCCRRHRCTCLLSCCSAGE